MGQVGSGCIQHEPDNSASSKVEPAKNIFRQPETLTEP